MKKALDVLLSIESIKIDTSKVSDKYRVYDASTFKMKNGVEKLDFIMGVVYHLSKDSKFSENPKKITEVVRILTFNGYHPLIVNAILNRMYGISILPSLSQVKVKNITFFSDLIERSIRSSDYSKLEKFYKISLRSSLFTKFIKSYGEIK